jgi:hypothetical protein
MILGTLSVLVPKANAVVHPINATSNTNAAMPGARITVLPDAATLFTPLRSVFGMFDTGVADADLGLPLVPFVTLGLIGDEQFVDTNGAPALYEAGMPIYRVRSNFGLGLVKVGDVRLTPVTVASTVYAAGSVVALGDLDQASPLVAFSAAVRGEYHVDDTGGTPGVYDVGEEIIRDRDLNIHITPGDLRLNFPNTVIHSGGDTPPQTYGLDLLVGATVFDYQEGLYIDAAGAGAGVVSVGDTRSREYIAPRVTYPADPTGLVFPILGGDRDFGLALVAFVTTPAPAIGDEVYRDLDGDGAYSVGEPIYRIVAAPGVTFVSQATDLRLTYVVEQLAPGLNAVYVHDSAIAAGDADIGQPYSQFVATETYANVDAVAGYSWRDWIYIDTDSSGTVNLVDLRMSEVRISDVYAFCGAGCPTSPPWYGAQAQLYGIQALAAANAHDPDMGIPLVAIPATWGYTGAVAGYQPEDPMYIDNDGTNAVSIGDTRLTVVKTAVGEPYPAPLPPPAINTPAPGAWYMPGSTVVALDADLGNVISHFTVAGDPNSFSENILVNSQYDSELFAHYASDAGGRMGPFPIPFVARTAHVAMRFEVPARTPSGNHVILVTTSEPTPGLAATAVPFWHSGFLASAAGVYPTVPAAGFKNPMSSLPFTDATAAPIRWNWNDMGTMCGPAFITVGAQRSTDLVQVFLHPGVRDPYKPGWSHTLDTVWGTVGGDAQQREFLDHYLDYAILTSASDSLGDLQFDVTVLPPGINWIDIFVPPEFQWRGATIAESIWTDITNDYQFIWGDFRNPRSAYDQIAPGWTRVRIGLSLGPGLGALGGTMTIPAGNYHIRLFNLAAPTVAGLYHFKIYVGWGAGVFYTSIGAGNYPVMVVKAELNPAWIMATVRTHLGIAPPFVSGRILAEGTTPEGRAVSAMGWWGPTEFIANNWTPGSIGAEYWVLIMGLAAGTYTLKAEASGYSPTTTDRLTLSAGQSYHTYIVIFDSPDVHVTIFSKHGTGEIPWHNLWQLPYGTNDPAAAPNLAGPRRDMMIELYDSNNVLIGFWASNFFFVAAPKNIAQSNRLMGLHDDGATIPTANQYNAWLRDNFDVLGNARGYPSTVWDGHVPWDTADYIAGMPNGQYSVEAFVTGYIMDETDSYQRSFTLSGTAYALQFDLRRSNWIETAMHLPANVFLSAPTTVTLTAEDAAGSERAAAAFTATPAMSADGLLDGLDVSGGAYAGGIVMEGWNVVFPNVGDRGGARDINRKDYGLNPSASSHSAGAVTLAGNPYTVKLYMADMNVPAAGLPGTGWWNPVGGDPQVSVFLCNSPQLLSFSIVNAWLWISMRSVDFEVPAHSRPWTFPGSEFFVEFLDSAGTAVDTLDPTIYGLVQDAGTTVPGFPIPGAPAGSFGVTPFDVDNINLPGHHEHLGVTYYGQDIVLGAGLPIYRALFDARSTRLPAGEYTFLPHTHGYVMRRSFTVQVPMAGGADIEADLIQGGQIRVVINFKHEAVATAFNGFIRVEVLDPAGNLVGASVYGMAEPNRFTQIGTPGGAYLPYDPLWTSSGGALSQDHKVIVGPAQGADFGLPAATYPSTRAGLGTPPTVGNGQRAIVSNFFYGAPAGTWAGWDDTTPSDANRLVMAAGDVTTFDIYGFYWYFGGLARTWAGGWPTTDGINNAQWDSGLAGSVDIPGWSGSGAGLYTVKVWAFDGRGPNGVYEAAPPTDDWRMYSMGWELSNIEVPWGGAQELFITMNNMAKLRGTVSWIDMYGDLRPLAWAQVTASNPDTVAYSTGNGGIGAGASDPSGEYVMWLPAGTHDVSISTSEAPEIWSASAPTQNAQYTVVVNDGWVGGGDTRLAHEEGVPVPELPSFVVPLSLFAALAASVWLLRKRSLNIPVMMK